MRRPSSPAIRTSSKPCTTVLHARQLHRSLCRAVCCGCDEPSSSIRHPGRTLDETFDALDVSAIRSGSAVAPPRDRLATFRSHAEGAEFRSRGQEGVNGGLKCPTSGGDNVSPHRGDEPATSAPPCAYDSVEELLR